MTICTRDRDTFFGDIARGTVHPEVVLNKCGLVVSECWTWLADQYPYIELDEWIVMPNHLHGIIVLSVPNCRGDSRIAPTHIKPLGRLIGAFKTVSTKRVNQLRGLPGLPIWQRNYYEHIVRDEADIGRIREYIVANPFNWDSDEENPANL